MEKEIIFSTDGFKLIRNQEDWDFHLKPWKESQDKYSGIGVLPDSFPCFVDTNEYEYNISHSFFYVKDAITLLEATTEM